MTVSRHHRLIAALALLALPFGSAVSGAQETSEKPNSEQSTSRQDAQPQDNPAKPQEISPQEAGAPAGGKANAQQDDKRSLYFFGGKPVLNRQIGPALKKPKSVLPQPFLPAGSIEVPPPAMQPVQPVNDGAEENNVSDAVQNQALPDGADVAAAGDIIPPVGGGANSLPADNSQLEGIPVEEPPVGARDEWAAKPDGALVVSTLDALDPSGISLLPQSEAYPASMWQGYSRDQIVSRLSEFRSSGASPALKQIASRIALSGLVVDRPENNNEITDFIEARLDVLAGIGDGKGYSSLLLNLPASEDWSPLARHFANAHLISGKITDACALAAAQREQDEDPFWLKLIVFCDAVKGNRAGVDFQLGILEEIVAVEPGFYQLVDQILVEAEQPPGAVLPAPVTLQSAIHIDVLEAVMARLARVKIEALAAEGVNPLAVEMMMNLPGVQPEAKTALIGLAVRRGWVDGAAFALYARTVEATEDALQLAENMAPTDDSFMVDATFAKAALAAQTAQSEGEALERIWSRFASQNYRILGARGLYALMGESSQAEPKAAAAVLARSAVAAGAIPKAQAWFRALRSQQAGKDGGLDAQLLGLLPLMTVAEGGTSLTTEHLRLWWEAQAENEKRFEQGNLLFSLLEALGSEVSEEAWSWLEEGPVTLAGNVAAPAQWRRFLLAARRSDSPAVLSGLFRLMSDGGPATLSPAVAGSVVGTLVEQGFEQEARLIATEIMIGQGL